MNKRNITITLSEELLPFVITSANHIKKIDGIDPLVWAIKGKKDFIVRLLLANTNEFDYNSAIIEAISKRNKEVLTLLLKEKTVDISSNSNPAIVFAASKGFTEIVKLLIDYGADVSACNNRAIFEAYKNEHTKVVNLLLENGATL